MHIKQFCEGKKSFDYVRAPYGTGTYCGRKGKREVAKIKSALLFPYPGHACSWEVFMSLKY